MMLRKKVLNKENFLGDFESRARTTEPIQTKEIDVLVIGGGPAALGLMINIFNNKK